MFLLMRDFGAKVCSFTSYTLNLERNWDIIMFTCNLKTVLAAGDNFGWKHLAHLSE